MSKLLITIALLGAVAIALAQIVNWDKVAKEYAPITNIYKKVVGQFATEEVVVEESVADEVTQIPVIKSDVDKYTVAMPVDDSDEIDNIGYDWLRSIARHCHPSYKDEVKSALKNDGIIRENEYHILISRCNDHNNLKEAAAKQKLMEFVEE